MSLQSIHITELTDKKEIAHYDNLKLKHLPVIGSLIKINNGYLKVMTHLHRIKHVVASNETYQIIEVICERHEV